MGWKDAPPPQVSIHSGLAEGLVFDARDGGLTFAMLQALHGLGRVFTKQPGGDPRRVVTTVVWLGGYSA